jgi:glycerophosphoryl diester phosphodiesterase
MIIISHRGLWNVSSEKNSKESFYKSFSIGFGVETDIRDYNGSIVISHDPAIGNEMKFEDFIELYVQFNMRMPLAFNVKSDGLQQMASDILKRHSVTEYFFFDMSTPDSIGYLDYKLKYYSRKSEIEITPVLLENAEGVWMDMFYSDWITELDISHLIENGKKVCIVSPELHNRPHLPFWKQLRRLDIIKSDKLLICTDHPLHANEFFNSVN